MLNLRSHKVIHFLLFCLFSTAMLGQHRLLNASFEGEPQDATVPQGWFACKAFTTPDILPGPWGVYNEPSHGESYIGLITRSNGTWESIGQRISKPLSKDYCYALSIDLAHSDTYAGYNGNLKLRIWLGTSKCEREQLILETNEITESEWTKFDVEFSAEDNHKYIIIEAYYTDRKFDFEGNILIDNLSDIIPCDRT